MTTCDHPENLSAGPASLVSCSSAPQPLCGVFISLPTPELHTAPIREPCWHVFHWESFNPAAVNLSWVMGGLIPAQQCFHVSPAEISREAPGSELAF